MMPQAELEHKLSAIEERLRRAEADLAAGELVDLAPISSGVEALCARLSVHKGKADYASLHRRLLGLLDQTGSLVRALNSELGVIEQALHEGNDRRQAYRAYLRPPPAEGS